MKKNLKQIILIFILFDLVVFTAVIWYFSKSSQVETDSKNEVLSIEKKEPIENKINSAKLEIELKTEEIQEIKTLERSEVKTTVSNKEFLKNIGFEFNENKNRDTYSTLQAIDTNNYLTKELFFFVKKSRNLSNSIDISVSYIEENSDSATTENNQETETSIQVKDRDGNLIEGENSSFSDISMMPIKVTDGSNFAVNIPYKYKDVEMVVSISMTSPNSTEGRAFLIDVSSLSSGDVLFVDF